MTNAEITRKIEGLNDAQLTDLIDNRPMGTRTRELALRAATERGLTPSNRDEYYAARVEHYRAMGEDYGTAYKWAAMDAQAEYGA